MPGSEREHWSLQDWLKHLESLQPAKFNLRLECVRKVAQNLDVIKFSAKVITVAGTNGKGSTVASLAAIYTTAGYQVGCFTSPHLFKFNERIAINNQHIPDDVAAQIYLQIDKARGDTELSFFEMALLCALVYFKKSTLDLIILEVGMGGRLDATNIIDADLSIITSIALDHQQYLGNTIEQIGFEKAGIMRSDKVCIFADANRPASVDAHAKNIKTELCSLDDDYSYVTDNDSLKVQMPNYAASPDVIELPIPNVNTNAFVAAVVASHFLQELLPVSAKSLSLSVQNIIIFARQQAIFRDKIQFIFDVAHNPHAVNALADFVNTIPNVKKIHAIFSGLAEKDLSGMLAPLLNLVDHWYPTSIGGRRAASYEQIKSLFATCLETDNIICFKTPNQALAEVKRNYQEGDLVVVYGSFMLVGAVMENLNNETCDV